MANVWTTLTLRPTSHRRVYTLPRKFLATRPSSTCSPTELSDMASLSMALAGAAGARVFAATAAAKGARSSGGEEKGLLDWILGGLQKEDQLVETDPVLKKVGEKATSATATGSRKSSGTTSVAVPKKKSGGFGGLFAKN